MLESIAILTMIVDHVGIVFYPHDLIFRAIGRASFIIYAYILSVSVKRTQNKLKYLLRILTLGVLSQGIYCCLISNRLNVCFTLAAGLLVIIIHESNIVNMNKCVLTLIVFGMVLAIGFDYGMYGVCVILIFYAFINKPMKYIVISQIFIFILSYFILGIPKMQGVSLIALLFIYVIRNNVPLFTKINWPIKYINYLIFPVHLIILLLLKRVMG